jgi:hypothetical protein
MARAPRLPGAPVESGGTTNASIGNQSSSSWQAPGSAGSHSRAGAAPEAGTGSACGQGTANPSRSAARWQLARNARLVGTMATPSTATAPAGNVVVGAAGRVARVAAVGPGPASSSWPASARAPSRTAAAASQRSLARPAGPGGSWGGVMGWGRWRPGGTGR